MTQSQAGDTCQQPSRETFRLPRLLVCLALLLLLLPWPPLLQAESGQPIPPVKVVVPPYLNCSPLFIALEEGFFAEQRIDVEFVTLNLSSQAIAPLLTGDVDVVMGILYPAYFNAVAKGASLRIVACRGYLAGGDCSWYALMARSGLLHSGRLSTLSGLAGLKHGLNSPSAHNSYFFDLLLDQAGLPADSVLGVS